MKRKVLAFCFTAILLVTVASVTTHVFASSTDQAYKGEYFSTTFGLPHPLPGHEKESQGEFKKLSRIGSPYGVFYRVAHQVDLPASEITRDPYHIEPQTKEVIADFGVFVRQ